MPCVQHDVATRYVPPVMASYGRVRSQRRFAGDVVSEASTARARAHMDRTYTTLAGTAHDACRRSADQRSMWTGAKDQATTPDSAGTSDVQKAQRVALIGMLLRQNGQSRVVGSTGSSVLRRDIR